MCRSPVLDIKERRSLESSKPNNIAVRNGLIQLSGKVEEDTPRCEDYCSHGYVCRKRFNLPLKFVNLTNTLIEIEKTIISDLSSIFSHCEPSARGTKRSISSFVTSTPKRTRIENNSASSSVVVS